MSINATLIGQMIWFALFIWITMKYVWPPLQKAMADRQQLIADGLAAGERGKLDLELASKRSADTIREAKEKAAGIFAEADKRAAQMIEEAKADARAEAEKVYNAKLAELEQDAERARSALRERVAELAVAGAEKILRREVNAAAHADMLAGLKQEL
ncbi:MAG: F0F1 ATP synthase subunit B [Gammaproteobacteria bacterium]|nr:F0F1 ATP synthase subunit B [Gammaproteobacteria bacterium]MBU1645512.1 F0F1 ATP synthase subunit B [Gammaproteobacteria bacterium]MBU1973686.1 F0F1 ATP synthase subunit B [Gammaproteobacteria bacterium]